jgi:hypothetical protein
MYDDKITQVLEKNNVPVPIIEYGLRFYKQDSTNKILQTR